jgi:DNA-binding NtrC family response regulator
MVNAKQFRVDLFERLGIIVELPPLRDRKEDLPLLVRQVLDDMGRVDLYAKVSGSTLAWMAQHSWEGNLRTLAKVVRLSVQLFDLEGHFDIEETYRIYRVSHEATSDEDWLESLLSKGASLDSVHEEATRRVLARLASECKGNVSRIAERAQITRVRAREWLTRLNLRTSDGDAKR